jgi:hypothetical protein
VNEADVVRMLTALPHVGYQLAGPDNGAPEVAWGDSFFFYEPDGPTARLMPFATIVTKNYPGFDTSSDLDRPEVYRLNLSVGRRVFAEVFGFGPAEAAEQVAAHRDAFDPAAFDPAAFDPAALDTLMPHPVYAAQSWVSVLVPGERTAGLARELAAHAHARAAQQYRPGRGELGSRT